MYKYLIYFLIFSFFGWCAEMLFAAVRYGRFVRRGLLRGPVCPIYGVGICLSYLLLGAVESFAVLVLLSMAVATIVEFFVGLFAHKALKKRLWDYSKEKGNILGYVCPRFSLIWGVVSAAVIRLLPRLDGAVALLDFPLSRAVAFVLMCLVVLDTKHSIEEGKLTQSTKI